MLAKCANPNCTIRFQYLRDGKVFELAFDSEGKLCPSAPFLVTAFKPVRTERFWLCGVCSRMLTLTYETGRGVFVAPLPQAQRAAAS
jgi:hypothetical protein